MLKIQVPKEVFWGTPQRLYCTIHSRDERDVCPPVPKCYGLLCRSLADIIQAKNIQRYKNIACKVSTFVTIQIIA